MTWVFTSFSIVFQSYQDDAGVVMKGCEQWNGSTLYMIEKISASSGNQTQDNLVSQLAANP